MIVGDLAAAEFSRRLSGPGLAVRCGPFVLRMRSDVASVHRGVALLYADHPLADSDGYCDYAVDILRVRGLRRWVRPQVRFLFDNVPTFEPLPIGHALPLLEWALNWCISTRSHQYLILHAAVIERHGFAAVLPAPPGSGKSTLCATLIHRGWRLLSDELALVSLTDGQVHALARPVSLKNRSIDIIGRFAPPGHFSARTHDTAKGTVAHLKPPVEHLARVNEPARVAWVIFPRYVAGAPLTLAPRSKADTMLELGRNAFNYAYSLRRGFEVLGQIVDDSACCDFSYSVLEEAIAAFDQLADERAALAPAPHDTVAA
jgi:HprK-related kinase A